MVSVLDISVPFESACSVCDAVYLCSTCLIPELLEVLGVELLLRLFLLQAAESQITLNTGR